MKKYLLIFLFSTCLYAIGFGNPLSGKPALKGGESNQFFTIYTSYQSSADDGGMLIEYPQAYNYVTPNTTVWLHITYPSGTPSWSHQGGTASTGQWNSYLSAWEFYMPPGGWGSFQVTVGGQTASYTILATDYLSLPVIPAPDKKESKEPSDELPETPVQHSNVIDNYAAFLHKQLRK